MSNLGLQSVYRLFNAFDSVVCERVFLPPRRDRQAGSSPMLRTVESDSVVGDFDVLAFSVSFEWDYTNVLTLLRLAGLPPYAEARSERHPLVVIGGAVTFLNPEPLAPFADVIAADEGEVLVPALVEAMLSSADRPSMFDALTGLKGFYGGLYLIVPLLDIIPLLCALPVCGRVCERWHDSAI